MSPEPRRRGIVIENPLAPKEAQPQAAPAGKPAPTHEAEPAQEAAARQRSRTSFEHPAGDGARARAAYESTHLAEGIRTYSEFVNKALMQYVARLESEYNGGRHFTGGGPLAPGQKTKIGV